MYGRLHIRAISRLAKPCMRCQQYIHTQELPWYPGRTKLHTLFCCCLCVRSGPVDARVLPRRSVCAMLPIALPNNAAPGFRACNAAQSRALRVIISPGLQGAHQTQTPCRNRRNAFLLHSWQMPHLHLGAAHAMASPRFGLHPYCELCQAGGKGCYSVLENNESMSVNTHTCPARYSSCVLISSLPPCLT